MSFQIGDRVRCVEPTDDLELDKVYTVYGFSLSGLITLEGQNNACYFPRRFIGENSDIPKEKKPTIVLNAKAKSTVPIFRNWVVWRELTTRAPDRCLSDGTPVGEVLYFRLRNMWEKGKIATHSTSLGSAFAWTNTKEGGPFWLALEKYLNDEIGEDEVPWDVLED